MFMLVFSCSVVVDILFPTILDFLFSDMERPHQGCMILVLYYNINSGGEYSHLESLYMLGFALWLAYILCYILKNLFGEK